MSSEMFLFLNVVIVIFFCFSIFVNVLMLLKCTTTLQGLETNKCDLQVMIKNFLNSYIVFWQLQDLLKSKASENIILSSTLGKHLVLHTKGLG